MGDTTKIQHETLSCCVCKRDTTHHTARTINSRYSKCLAPTPSGNLCFHEEYVGPRGHEKVDKDGKWVAVESAKRK